MKICLMPTAPRTFGIVYERADGSRTELVMKEGFDILSALAWYLAEDVEENLSAWRDVEIELLTLGDCASFWIGDERIIVRDMTDYVQSAPHCIVPEPHEIEPLRKRRIKRKVNHVR